MQPILEWGLEVVQSIQTIENPPLTALMLTITYLGSKYAYIPLLLYVFWCMDERKGLRLAVALLMSAWINDTFKNALKQPRPYDLDPSVKRAYEPTIYGLPSGHAQNAVTVWGVLGSWLGGRAGVIVAITATLAVSFSCLYLGFHFPTDLLAGWILGGIILGVYFAFGNLLESMLSAANLRVRILTVAAVAFVMNALNPADTSLGGAFFGMGAGYILMTERFPFSAALGADGKPTRISALALRYLIGLAGAAIIYVGLKTVLPGPDSSWFSLGRFSRYALLGAWATAAAPWIFLRLKLAGARSTDPRQARE